MAWPLRDKHAMTLYQFTVIPKDPETPKLYAHIHARGRDRARVLLFEWLNGIRNQDEVTWSGWTGIEDGCPADKLELTITRTGGQWLAGRDVWAVFGISHLIAVREGLDYGGR